MKNTTRQSTPTIPTPNKREPQDGRGLFGVHLLILRFKFQFSKPIKSSTFHIFLSLAYPLKRDRDIDRKAVLSDVKTTFTCNPALGKIKMDLKGTIFVSLGGTKVR